MPLDITTMAGYPRYAAALTALNTAQSAEDTARASAAAAQTALANANAVVDSSVRTRITAKGELAASALALRAELTAALAPAAQAADAAAGHA